MKNHDRFRGFVRELTSLVEREHDTAALLAAAQPLLGALVGHDDWLPEECAKPHPKYYQQYLLHCDPFERVSVVSFVWAPGQRTPVHDHTVWGMVGVLRGAETCRRYLRAGADQPLIAEDSYRLGPGQVDLLSPTLGDIHEVANALAERASISIHVYGGNIGALGRHVYDPLTGTAKPFVSGYSNSHIPNFWDRSEETRARLQRALA